MIMGKKQIFLVVFIFLIFLIPVSILVFDTSSSTLKKEQRELKSNIQKYEDKISYINSNSDNFSIRNLVDKGFDKKEIYCNIEKNGYYLNLIAESINVTDTGEVKSGLNVVNVEIKIISKEFDKVYKLIDRLKKGKNLHVLKNYSYSLLNDQYYITLLFETYYR